MATLNINPSNVTGVCSHSLAFDLDGPDIKYWRDRPVMQQQSKDANMQFCRFFEHRIGKVCSSWQNRSFNWIDLDLLVQRLLDNDIQPIICLGFIRTNKADQVTYGAVSTLPDDFPFDPNTLLPYPADWAEYCGIWARHYKGKVGTYEVFNEPYQYFGWPAQEPKLSYWMNDYNVGFDAMKQVDPLLQISNDAVTLKLVLQKVLANGTKIDTVNFHRYATGDISISDSVLFNLAETYGLTESSSYYAPQQARSLVYTAIGKSLPILLTEYNVNYAWSNGTDIRNTNIFGAVHSTISLMAFIKAGVNASFFFHHASSKQLETQKATGWGFGLVNRDDNTPYYPYYAQKMIGPNLSIGDKFVSCSSDSANLRTIAWIHEGKLVVLIACKTHTPEQLNFTGVQGSFTYEKIDETIPSDNPQLQKGTLNLNEPFSLKGYTVLLLQQELATKKWMFSHWQDGDANPTKTVIVT